MSLNSINMPLYVMDTECNFSYASTEILYMI
jgi:hypothetical protein